MTNESSSSRSTDEHRCPPDTLLGLINVLLTSPKSTQVANGAVTASKASKSKKKIKHHRPLVRIDAARGTIILSSAFRATWPAPPPMYGQRPHAENAKTFIRKYHGRNQGWDGLGDCNQYSASAIVWLISLRTPQP